MTTPPLLPSGLPKPQPAIAPFLVLPRRQDAFLHIYEGGRFIAIDRRDVPALIAELEQYRPKESHD